MKYDYPGFSVAIAVKDGAKAIEFYTKAFGAKERFRLIDPQTKGVGHAEMDLKDGLLMLADEYKGMNATPETLGGTTAKLSLMTDDVDRDFEKAVAAGATVIRKPADQFYGHRAACVRDPFGHEWIFSQILKEVSPEEMQRIWNEMPEGGSGA